MLTGPIRASSAVLVHMKHNRMVVAVEDVLDQGTERVLTQRSSAKQQDVGQ